MCHSRKNLGCIKETVLVEYAICGPVRVTGDACRKFVFLLTNNNRCLVDAVA